MWGWSEIRGTVLVLIITGDPTYYFGDLFWGFPNFVDHMLQGCERLVIWVKMWAECPSARGFDCLDLGPTTNPDTIM